MIGRVWEWGAGDGGREGVMGRGGAAYSIEKGDTIEK